MPEPKQAVVAILATGGTIAGVQTTTDATAYQAAAFSVEQLLDAVPSLCALATIRAQQIASLGSQDMTHEVWLALAQRIDELCRDDTVDGIVVTHGTDTIEETAYFLSLIIRHEKALVLVGSMRPATALSADGPANLYAAVALAANKKARGKGPLVLMNDDIYYARDVQKIACTGINAFASPNRGNAGFMRGKEPVFISTISTRHTLQSEFSLDILLSSSWPRVDLVSVYVGLNAALVDHIAAYADGIVLVGVGDGNASEKVLHALANASSAGVAVVRASRTGKGAVTRNVEVDDDARGFVSGGDLNPSKARILLMLALFQNRNNPGALQRIFDQY